MEEEQPAVPVAVPVLVVGPKLASTGIKPTPGQGKRASQRDLFGRKQSEDWLARGDVGPQQSQRFSSQPWTGLP